MKVVGTSLTLVIGLLFSGLTAFFGGTLKGVEQINPLPKEITMDVRLTYGEGGSTRPAEMIAGEELNATISISGIELTPSGKIECSINCCLIGPTGEVLTEVPEKVNSSYMWLRDPHVTQYFSYSTPPDAVPGKYQFSVRVLDREGNKLVEKNLSIDFLSNQTFGAADIGLFHDKNGDCPAKGVFAVETEIFMQLLLVGCDTSSNRLFVKGSINIVDENGKAIHSKPVVFTFDKPLNNARDVNIVKRGIPTGGKIGVKFPGKFWIQMELHDKMGDLIKVYKIPIVVVSTP